MVKVKILIIDDEIDYCLLMKGYFLSKNYEVFMAHNLKDGLMALEKERPDDLFLDNNLPDGEGWQLTDQLLTQYPNLNIHLISSYKQTYSHNNKPNVKIWEKPISLDALNQIF